MIHVVRPDGAYDEWTDGDTATSPLLPGFTAGVSELIAVVS
jgi:hypothetical protein